MKLSDKETREQECLKKNNGICPSKAHPKNPLFYCPYRHSNGKGNHMDLDQQIKRTKDWKLEKQLGVVRPMRQKEKRINPPIVTFWEYDKLSLEQKAIMKRFPKMFHKEHEKEKDFENIYKPDSLIKLSEQIIAIGIGGTFEFDDYGNTTKNEVCTLIELGYLKKLLLVGLKGNPQYTHTEETKEVKYQEWKNLEYEGQKLDDSQFVRTWVDSQTPLLIPYSDKQTHFLILVDGCKETASPEFLKSLIIKRPNCTIDFFALRGLTQTFYERELGIQVKLLWKWTQPPPPLFYYRIIHHKVS